MYVVDWQLFSNWPAFRGLQTTVCQWVDLGLFNRQMYTLSFQYTRYVCACVYHLFLCNSLLEVRSKYFVSQIKKMGAPD